MKIKNLLTKTLLVAAGLCVGASAWAEDAYTAVYTKALSGWLSTDVSSTEWVATNVTPTISTETGKGLCCSGAPSGGYSVTKTFSITANAKVKYEGVWTVNRVTGRDGNYCYIQFGSNIRISVPNGGKFYLDTNGTSSSTTPTGVSTSDKNALSYNFSIIINTATSTVESCTFGGKNLTSMLTSSISGDFNSFTIGFQRGGSGSSENNLTSLTVSQCEQAVTNANYTINYKVEDNVVKTVASTSVVGAEITADAAVDGEGTYAGNHYLITAAEAPSMTLVAGDNVLNVPVRAPYTATLNVTTSIAGVAGDPVVKNLVETDTKVCAWNYTYPMYVKSGDNYYVADNTAAFGESGTFTNGETINKTVSYTNVDESVMAFTEVGTGTNTAYSGGGYTNVNSQLANCTLGEGLYRAEIFVVSKAGNGSNFRTESVMAGGESKGSTANNATGLQKLPFTITSASTEVYVKGNGSTDYTDNLDYVLIRKLPLAEGEYYLKNKATGAYFAAGLNWNTQAITNSIGHIVTMTMNSDLTWKVDVNINSQYLSSTLWCDGTAQNWILTSDGAGYYTIGDGTNYITAGASGEALSLTTGTGDNTKWQFLTAAEWKAENVTRLDAAAANNGVDATFYIPAANFNRRDGENSKWQGSPNIDGENVNANNNFNAQKFTETYAVFDVYQELTGLKPGAYKLTAQGFYRNGLENTDATIRRALLYANDVTAPLVNIASDGKDAADASNGFSTAKNGKYVPDSQSDVSKAFNAGYYNNELYVVVGDGGTLRLGVKKTDASGSDKDWACFDNFQLTYYGESDPVTVTSAGYATYVNSSKGLDFSATSIKAYKVQVTAKGVATMTQVNQVPAGTPVLLYKEGGATEFIPVTTGAAAVSGNDLVAGTGATVATNDGEYTNMILNNIDSKIGFYFANGQTVATNRAYLHFATSYAPDVIGGAPMMLVFADEDMQTTGISDVRSKTEDVRGNFFDLSGRRVAQPTKGLYIMNGKKVAIK